MEVFSKIEDIRRIRKQNADKTWGLVPTMGSLHAGHMSLITKARNNNKCVGVSIFVNPKQFNNPDDLEKYPRDIKRDLAMLELAGVDLVWTPGVEDIYPPDFQTYVDIADLGQPLEGASRPGHFRGVCTVVSKLFNVFQPHNAYFGQKDAQQALIIRQMVKDLNFDINIEICPIFREEDGLAMSSRNVRLSSEDRRKALVLSQSLNLAQDMFFKGETHAEVLIAAMLARLNSVPGVKVDYVSINDAHSLKAADTVKSGDLVSLAAVISGVRLIDNILIK